MLVTLKGKLLESGTVTSKRPVKYFRMSLYITIKRHIRYSALTVLKFSRFLMFRLRFR